MRIQTADGSDADRARDQAGGAVAPAPLDLGELYRAHRLDLVRLAALLVDDRASAEDVVHDAFINVHRSLDRLRDQDAALGYLRVAVVNGARSVLRRRRTVRSHLRSVQADEVEPTGPAADDGLLFAAEQRAVLAALHTLPQRQREVLTLRYWSELNEAEIAHTLGISTGAVKSHAHRGLNKLEALLGDSR